MLSVKKTIYWEMSVSLFVVKESYFSYTMQSLLYCEYCVSMTTLLHCELYIIQLGKKESCLYFLFLFLGYLLVEFLYSTL